MQRINNFIYDRTLAVWFGAGALMASAMSVAAEESSASANIRGALKTNQDALTAVKGSTFTGEGVKGASQNTLNAVLYAVGAVGVIMVVAGIWNLFNHYKEGEQARGKASTGVLMIVIGGLMTIPAIITAVAPNLFVGAATSDDGG